ncbi:MAG: hypothetical protein ACYC4R_03845 [Anaerolineae bacterium]
MSLTYDRCASHRWFDNTQRWLSLYRERGLSLDQIAFENDLMPGLSGMKAAFLYYAAQRAMYLIQSELLVTVFRAEPADWEEEVDALAARGMEEYLSDVRELLATLDLDPNALSPADDYWDDSSERNWAEVLHALEELNIARPRSEASLVAWLSACLDAKLAEVAQSLRRAALGHWLARRHGVDALAALVDANLDPFAWRILNRVQRRFEVEKVDPRSGRAIRWDGLRTDSDVHESAAFPDPRLGNTRWYAAGGTLKALYGAAVRGQPVQGSRHVETCPRVEVFARASALATERWGPLDAADVQRVFCKFCFMHAYAEMLRGVPAFLTVERIEASPHMGQEGGCGFQWTCGFRAAALLGRGRDAARLAYAARAGEEPPNLVFIDELPPSRSAVDLSRSTWDRTCLT